MELLCVFHVGIADKNIKLNKDDNKVHRVVP